MSTTFVVRATIKNETYELDFGSLTGLERIEAKRILGVDQFEFGQLLNDEIGAYVIAYLAAKRVRPNLSPDDVLSLPARDLSIDFGLGDGEEKDPFSPSATKASPAKRSASKPSSAE
ncbi:hypothetical protein [Patulibacter defluvii]|uniref:hypothetical protein n=1 Tax=Patulibacter defluvii TaxID=3095358 RepID=UPI002A75E88E|nr:hypothetical protein [Patulibacter sp. DM4]